MAYAELLARSCYSLLEGASQPHELAEAAAHLGIAHLGLVDRDGIYGLVQAHKACADHGVHLVCGATVTVVGHPSVVLLVEDRSGWTSLCRILTRGRAEEPKGRSRVPLDALLAHARGLTCVLRPGWGKGDHLADAPPLTALREAFGPRLGVAVLRDLTPADTRRVSEARALAQALGVPLLATADPRMHAPERRIVADVLTCIRRRTTLREAGGAVAANAERRLLAEREFRARYADLPTAIAAGEAAAERCTFSLSELRYGYPKEVVPDGFTSMSWLGELTERGLERRYPAGVPESVRAAVVHELRVIEELDFPSYFLTVQDVVAFARSQGILCQGRGSAANSAVCYALGVTAVDPSRASLLFERFISKERGEPPDIDIDFEHERREEVLQYVYGRYGRDRAAMVNEFICYRQRSAVREVGKTFGLSLDQVDRLAKSLDRWSAGLDTPRPEDVTSGRTREKWSQPHEGGHVAVLAVPSAAGGGSEEVDALVREAGLDPASPEVRATLHVSAELAGFPRHVSIHVGGFVIAAGSLGDLVPIEPATMANRTVLQWDKYDVEALDFVKVDLLGLGMLTAIRKAFDLVSDSGGPKLDLGSVPAEDPAVYDMFCNADTVGVFQIESRAQMSMLPRLRPRSFYDLVVEVAIVRPGPIQGGMVHPYLRRRMGDEPVSYAHPALVPILERTLGVPLFQEQVMAMAVAVGGFTAGEADRLRRAMGAWRKRGNLTEMGQKLVEGMIARGIARDYANAVFAQILGFGEYGFPESHAASFALLVYVSGWLKCHHPAAFTAALVNSQPMGFYSPRALVADAQRHGVEVRSVCVVRSSWDCTLEPTAREGPPGVGGPAMRLGLRMLRGFGEEHAAAIVDARAERPFRTLADLAVRTGLDQGRLTTLAESGALELIAGPERRRVAWEVQGLWTGLPLFAALGRTEPSPDLPPLDTLSLLQADFRSMGVSVDLHPIALVRSQLDALGCTKISALQTIQSGAPVRIAGLVSSRQRPGTAAGVVFLTLEDETGMANVVVWPRTWAEQRRLARTANMLGVDGHLQRQDAAVSVLVDLFWPMPEPPSAGAEQHDVDPTPQRLASLPLRSRDFH